MEDGPGRSLVLRSVSALPAAPDHHDIVLAGQILGDGTGVDEGAGQDGLRAAGGLHDAGPVVVERATVEPGGIFKPRISVGELPKSKLATFALPRSPMRKSVSAEPASSTDAKGTTLAPFETSTATVVLALKASTTTTTEPEWAAARAPLSPPA